MINRLNGFFSSESWLLHHWQLSVAGLLLVMTGLTATLSALQAAAPKEKLQTASDLPVASSFETVTPQPSTPAVEPPVVTPGFEAVAPAPQPSTPAAEPPVVAPSVETVAPVPQVAPQAAESPVVAPSIETVAPSPQPIAQTVDAPEEAAMPSAKWNPHAQAASKATVAQAPIQNAEILDGIYLYGQSSEPEQAGREYLVFEARQGKVIGALYMANSEYSCFYGTLDSRQMNLTVANAYEQTAFAHAIALMQPAQVAAAGGRINLENTYDSLTYPHAVGLEGYQPISQLGASDKQILSTCLDEHQHQFGN